MNEYLDPLHGISLETLEGYTFFTYMEIVRFEVCGDHTWVYLTKEAKPQKVLHTLTEVEEKISGNALFYKCHRSHIVGMKHVKCFCVKTNTLVTEKGEVPIADAYVKDFKDRYCK